MLPGCGSRCASRAAGLRRRGSWLARGDGRGRPLDCCAATAATAPARRVPTSRTGWRRAWPADPADRPARRSCSATALTSGGRRTRRTAAGCRLPASRRASAARARRGPGSRRGRSAATRRARSGQAGAAEISSVAARSGVPGRRPCSTGGGRPHPTTPTVRAVREAARIDQRRSRTSRTLLSSSSREKGLARKSPANSFSEPPA